MKRLYIRRVVAITATIATIVIVFYLYLPQQVSIIDSMNVTVGEGRVDVACVGSSHVYCGINPVQMHQDKGIAAYDIAIGSQAPWQSYYFIKEICKTQKPKVIIYDTYMVGSKSDDGFQDNQTVSNLLDCHMSLDLIKAILESDADSKLSILLRYPYIYDKYDQYTGLTFGKLYGAKNKRLGYSPSEEIKAIENVIDVSNVFEVGEISVKREKYLRLIIEYCKNNGIDIVLTNTPWPGITEESQMRFNKVGEIAEEYDIPFVDGCKLYKEMGIDYSTDTYDGGHLNNYGIAKYTKWLETFLCDNYSLPDRRGEEGYESYEMICGK